MTHISFYGNDELVSAYICMGEQISQQIYVFNHPVNNTKILYYYSAKTTYHLASSRITILYISKILHLPKHKRHKLLLTNSVMV